MINPQDFSKSKPVIKPADLNGAKVAVLTVINAEEIDLNGDKKVVMQFEEFPDKNYFPNLTSIRNLVDALGADEKAWPGERAVLEVVKTNDPVKKRSVEALWVASSETWDDHLAQAEKAAARRATTSAASAGNGETSPSVPARKSAAKKETSRRR